MEKMSVEIVGNRNLVFRASPLPVWQKKVLEDSSGFFGVVHHKIGWGGTLRIPLAECSFFKLPDTFSCVLLTPLRPKFFLLFALRLDLKSLVASDPCPSRPSPVASAPELRFGSTMSVLFWWVST